MYWQPCLFDLPLVDADNEIKDRFEEFHRQNPSIYKEFEDLAINEIHNGAGQMGAKYLLEYIRWNNHKKNINTPIPCNNFFPYYARLFIKNNPRYKSFFELRPVRERNAKKRL